MSRRFHAEAGETGPFDAARVSMFLSAVCREGRAAMFVALDQDEQPTGFLVCQAGENYLTGELIAEETALYVYPTDRNKKVGRELIAAFEDWGREIGAKKFRTTAQTKLRPDAVSRMFGRIGYREAERSFIKEVDS